MLTVLVASLLTLLALLCCWLTAPAHCSSRSASWEAELTCDSALSGSRSAAMIHTPPASSDLTSPVHALLCDLWPLCLCLTSCLFFLFSLSGWIAPHLPPPLPPFFMGCIHPSSPPSSFCFLFYFLILPLVLLLHLFLSFLENIETSLLHFLSPYWNFLLSLITFPCFPCFLLPFLPFLHPSTPLSYPSLPSFIYSSSIPHGGASRPSVHPMTSPSAACSRSASQFGHWLHGIQQLCTGNRKRRSCPQTPPPLRRQRLPHWFLSPLKPRPLHGKSGTLLARACCTSSASFCSSWPIVGVN